MKKIRKSKLIQLLCITLSITFTYLGCTSSPSGNPVVCSPLEIQSSQPARLADQFESMLELARTVDAQQDASSYQELHEHIFGEEAATAAHFAAVEQEFNNYQSLGFEAYVQSKAEFSDPLKDQLTLYAQELHVFLSTQQPSLAEFTAFTSSQQDLLTGLELCENDRQIMAHFIALNQGYAQYFYQHYYSDESIQMAEVRGCNFWQALECGAYAVAGGLTLAFLAGAGIKIIISGMELLPEEQDLIRNLAELATAIYVGITIYEWCCDQKGMETQECIEPSGFTYRQSDCNEFVITLFGPSDYGETQWDNDNTDPDNIITNIPQLRFTVPGFSFTSKIEAFVSCRQDANTIEVFRFGPEILIFESNDNIFPLQWISAPPSIAFYDPSNFSFPASVILDVPEGQQYTYNWSINEPHQIEWESNSARALIQFQGTGEAITTVRVTDNCISQTETLSATTIIE